MYKIDFLPTFVSLKPLECTKHTKNTFKWLDIHPVAPKVLSPKGTEWAHSKLSEGTSQNIHVFNPSRNFVKVTTLGFLLSLTDFSFSETTSSIEINFYSDSEDIIDPFLGFLTAGELCGEVSWK